ncbi:unnamed protein product [Blepharisma stoltei]|uniref:Cytochrome b561 domain-containing protein n=1 Tax=Blepharisma stoltei TaxID=1481888 RepID=A0AAU9J2E7_9CILI|nr:unnamed protein product [Blepharisma stoltei]
MYVAIGGGDTVSPIFLIDLWSENHDEPSEDTDYWSGTEDVIDVTGYYDPSYLDPATGETTTFINATFSRLLNTGDIWDTIIEADKHIDINWGYKKGKKFGFDEHDSYSQGRIKFARSADNESFSKEDSKYFGLAIHLVLMTIFWTIMAPIAIMVARYGKHLKCWYWCHLISFAIVIIGTIISVSYAYQIHHTPTVQTTKKPRYHSRLGFIITCLILGQGFIGLICKFLQTKSSVFSIISQVRRAHKAIGYGLLILALMNNTYGFAIMSMEIVHDIMLAICLAIMFLFELRHQLSFWKPGFLCLKKLPEMSHQEAMEMIEKEGAKLMFCDELVMNIGPFITSHPGGGYMLRDTIGEDAGKYMVGCSSINGELMPYAHSRPAFDYTKKLAIAKVPYPEGYLEKLDESETNNLMHWAVSFQHALNETTRLISLSSPHFRLSQEQLQPSYIGKHFKVTAKIGGTAISRYYSAFFADLHSWAQELDNSGKLSNNYPACSEGNLQLIYRVYGLGKITQYLSNLSAENIVELKGPLGPGLLLNNYSGNYLGFAGGTGIIPFLDVVHYLWLSKDNPSSLKLTLFASFRTVEDAFCIDLLEETSRILGEDKFKFVVMVDKQAKDMNFPEIIKKYAGSNPDRAWVCGPSGYNNFIKSLLIEGGLGRKKIIVM